MFFKVMRKFKIDLKIGFITTDGESNEKCQVNLTSMEDNIIIEIYGDPSELMANDYSKQNEAVFEEML